MSKKESNTTIAQILRKRAEEQLKEKQKKVSFSDEKVDPKRLLHELQVHQIELEMQNEELQHVYETAETALKKYTMLYDFAPMGYFTLDSTGIILDLNFTGAEMLGDKRFSLENKNFRVFIYNDSLPIFDKFFKKVYKSNQNESCKVTLGFNNEPTGLVYIEGIVTGDDRNCLLSLVDISRLMNS